MKAPGDGLSLSSFELDPDASSGDDSEAASITSISSGRVWTGSPYPFVMPLSLRPPSEDSSEPRPSLAVTRGGSAASGHQDRVDWESSANNYNKSDNDNDDKKNDKNNSPDNYHVEYPWYESRRDQEDDDPRPLVYDFHHYGSMGDTDSAVALEDQESVPSIGGSVWAPDSDRHEILQ